MDSLFNVLLREVIKKNSSGVTWYKYTPLGILFALGLTLPFSASAAASVGHTATKQDAGSTTTMSWTHNATGDSDLLACVGFANGDVSNLVGTFNGSPLLEIAHATTSGTINTYLFKLHNPAQGSYNLSFSWTTARSASGGSISFTGSGGVGAAVPSTSNWTTNPTTITRTGSVSDDDILFGCFNDDKASAANLSVTAGTSHWLFSESTGYLSTVGLTATGSGSVNLGVQESISGNPNSVASIVVTVLGGVQVDATTTASGVGAVSLSIQENQTGNPNQVSRAAIHIPTNGAGEVSVDATSTATGSSGTSASLSHVVGAYATELIAQIAFGNGDVTGLTCTYNNATMTQLTSVSNTDSWMYVFHLAGPQTGNNTLLCSWSNSRNWSLGAVTLTNAGTPTVASTSATFWSSNPTQFSISCTLISGDDLCLGLWADDKANKANTTINQTQVWSVDATGYTGLFANMTSGIRGTAASLTHTTGVDATQLIAQIAFGEGNPTSLGCTYNGDSMTQIASVSSIDSWMYVFALSNPDTASNSLDCTWSGTRHWSLASISFVNAATSSVATTSSVTINTNPQALSLSCSLSAGDLCLGLWADDRANKASTTVNQSKQWGVDVSRYVGLFGNTAVGVSSTSVSIQENDITHSQYASQAAILIPEEAT